MRTRLPVMLALPRRRPVIRASAWAVVLAILLESWLAPSIAMRMAMDDRAAASTEIAALCHGHGAGDETPDSGAPAGHQHDHCLICKGIAVPILVGADVGVAPAPPGDRPAGDAAPRAAMAEAPAAHYDSRAPPAIV